jgi:hypothetical protein
VADIDEVSECTPRATRAPQAAQRPAWGALGGRIADIPGGQGLTCAQYHNEVLHRRRHAKSIEGVRREPEDRRLRQSDQFEAFINYIVVSDLYPEEFDFNIVATGKGEFGIDGVAIIVNDAIVDDEEQLDDIIEHNPVLQINPISFRSGQDQFVV